MTSPQSQVLLPPDSKAGVRPAIALRGIEKTFGSFTAVKNLNLDISSGEFFSLLGPSGSGKTTVLRMIAGFEHPTAGTIELDGEDVTKKAPFERAVNTVFQDYALFPHLSVAQNVEYGLKLRKIPRAERQRMVAESLEMIQLPHVAKRLPSQLSGGQRQRVALARALILKPQVLLLDEPLGALDKQLREQMQIELKQIQREVGITFVFVTHDQEEALSLSDRVAVFNEGNIDQVGTPADLYQRPTTRFVASFLGHTNLIEGQLAQDLIGSAGTFSLRPEHLRVHQHGTALGEHHTKLRATVREVVYTGSCTRFVAATPSGTDLIFQELNGASDRQTTRGAEIELEFDRRNAFPI
ncbi:ABC transporter ATP-binding protein [Glutamicibacter arilaitensis]|uniref:ABC transporter ATP-binding protein n=1 Tax=Glutamicibacter arilaitensis TaxID=256701 RepID=UPI003A8D4BE0